MLSIGFGYKFLIAINQKPEHAMYCFFALSLGKIAGNLKAMQVLQLRTLNPERLELCVKNMDDMSISSVAVKENIFKA